MNIELNHEERISNPNSPEYFLDIDKEKWNGSINGVWHRVGRETKYANNIVLVTTDSFVDEACSIDELVTEAYYILDKIKTGEIKVKWEREIRKGRKEE